jgi:hypothetical protein
LNALNKSRAPEYVLCLRSSKLQLESCLGFFLGRQGGRDDKSREYKPEESGVEMRKQKIGGPFTADLMVGRKGV